jgi:hypothetical protein
MLRGSELPRAQGRRVDPRAGDRIRDRGDIGRFLGTEIETQGFAASRA